MTKKKGTDRKEWRTEKGIKLGDSTTTFKASESKKAKDFANIKGSYMGEAYVYKNIDGIEKGEFVGFYVPA